MVLSQQLFDFVRDNAYSDVNALRLKYSGKSAGCPDFPIDFALLQIEARKKTRKKLPGFLEYDQFLFPSMVAAEQSSNQAVAAFHASLLEASDSVLDLTAGLGIDDFSIARSGVKVTACEIENEKCNILRHNISVLDISGQVIVENTDSIDFVMKCQGSYDAVFADPARRDSSGGRVHALGDCQPDILTYMDKIIELAPRLLVKCSPLLDLSLITESVRGLHSVYVVCFRGECKEVLIEIRRDRFYSDSVLPINVCVIDLDWDKEISRFSIDGSLLGLGKAGLNGDRKSLMEYRYLYEPNAGIMKTGAWQSLVDFFPALSKADINTHIFFSDELYTDFPGRVMHIVSQPDKKALKSMKSTKINVVSRNHPLSAPQIASKYSLIPGGDDFLYAFRFNNVPSIIVARPILPFQE